MPALIGGASKRIVTAYNLKTYAGLSNRVDISDDWGDRIAYIRPPMWFFTFANQIVRRPFNQLGFYLEQVDRTWMFGVDHLESEWSADLIVYRRSELPYWATEAYQDNLKEGTEATL